MRQERATRTRRSVLVAAASVFDEVGYEAATISEILKRSGVTKGALYFHFPSKQALAQAVLASQFEAVPAVPAQPLKLQEWVDEGLLLGHMLKSDPLVRGSIRLTVDQGSPMDSLDRRVPMQSWMDYTQGTLEKAKNAGEVLPTLDAAAMAKLIVGGFTGVQVLSKIMTDHRDMTERASDYYRYLLPSIAVPGVLMQIDYASARGEHVYEEAMKLRRAAEENETEANGSTTPR
ncbi:ScbR family autoregulator-binding transcription factor [Streptomyces sp. LHD-70]|uniref:ScbR family autoregulator-binding transcription factor n=1 Tax=Streptomyces sp. LHD-70 TaxID=3072140 RepID=UPI00281044C5|nr:ScbR family autoregulator-binding transcription factor [Streptomyces sp. LHD-70]MDQ8707180.1 ScbR family autoregulator-binding transcription factor [Streptomyces sp. LHD-70]